MKIVVISGSPRKKANTQVIMKYVFEYAKSKNQDTKLINLSEGQIECYRGPEPFSEPETKALRTFLNEHQKQIKFVYNFHSNGNMWIYPYNGRVDNDIETRNPGILPIF